ncbi:MAG TPA: DUF3842 family protein [Spirochaetales bacterium]|nr:DUF3842 family protein [Spirochaetales bacterium]HPB66976.1 DUF3842 family protein [Spirochaetales bacterium]HPG87352.1 DUF3842 family protein [Spirochaetales bacterium]HPM72328.1 DUF3842 family protein [Spirochaetales bacterium]HQO67146.1 DUF3842 family protein [Spirochaetales bacterium]
MRKTIVVVDGMGGGLGAQLIAKTRELIGDAAEIVALGANSCATERMLKAGADRGASGENAVRVSVGLGDVVLGPIGVIAPNAMMGEITPAMAEAVFGARGRLVLVPAAQRHFTLVGVEKLPMAALIAAAAAEAVAALGLGG